MNRRILPRVVAGAAVLALAAVAGCGSSGGGEKSGKTSFSLQGAEPQHLIPGNCNDLYGIQVIRTLFTGLVAYDPKTTKPVNMMAKSITSKDQQHWTIKIKKGWTFHNGEKVTAQSYIDSWNYTAYAPHGYANNYFFANIQGYDAMNPEKGKPTAKTLSGLTKVNDYTFKVALDAPFSQFPITLGYSGFFPVPKEAIENPKKFDQKPIGNGPYEMDGKWKHDQYIKMAKYKDYKGSNAGHVDEINFKMYTDDQTAYNDLTAGDLDLANVPVGQLDQARQTLGDRYLQAATSGFYHLDFPVYDKRYDNRHLRYAISMAINRKAIIDKILGGASQPADSLVSPVVGGKRDDPCGVHCTYNPKMARAELKKAGGWHGTMVLWSSTDKTFEAWMEAIAHQLRKNLGIKHIELKNQQFTQYLTSQDDHKITGPMENNWYMDYPSMQNYLEPIYATNGSSNRIGYSNKVVDAAIKKGNASPTIQQSYKYYYKAEDQVLKDMPAIPLWYDQTQQARSDRITHVILNPFGTVRLDQVRMAG